MRCAKKILCLIQACCLLGLLNLLASLISPAMAEETPWRVGWASRKVTPTEPVRMAGYASRDQLSSGVASDLYAKALLIEDGDGNRGLLITCDVIGFAARISQPLYERIEQATGLKRNQILLNASHTHTGPVLGLSPEHVEHFEDPEHVEPTVRHTNWLLDQLVELATEATEHLRPASLSWGTGVANFVMNRREFSATGVRLGVNPRGLADRSVPVLCVRSMEGTIRCVVFGAACHNTTLGPRDYLISPDFAGYAQQEIENVLGETQAMFVQGCAGDANPYPRGSEEIARVHGQTLGREVLNVLEGELASIAGPLTTVVGKLTLPLNATLTADELQRLEEAGGAPGSVAKEMRERLAKGESLPDHYQTEIGLWQFADDLTWVALPGEVVVDYVPLIENAIGPRGLWISAYCHDVFGYLPSARVLEEGGYEMRGIYTGGFGIFSSDAQQAVVELVSDLAAQAR